MRFGVNYSEKLTIIHVPNIPKVYKKFFGHRENLSKAVSKLLYAIKFVFLIKFSYNQ